MFQISGDFGVLIDENAVNVGLVHTHEIVLPTNTNEIDKLFFHTDFYFGEQNGGGIVIDIPMPDHIKYPIVGISFKYGVGYAQLSFRKDNKRITRVFISIHKQAFLEHYPNYAYASNMTAAGFMLEVFKKEPFKVLFFDISPPMRQSGLGLEIFNSKGEIVYDSDLPTVNFPPDIYRNADNYRSFVICQSFVPLYAIFNHYHPPITFILEKLHAPLLWLATKTHGHGEMSRVLTKMNPGYIDGNPNALRIVSDFEYAMQGRVLLCSY